MNFKSLFLSLILAISVSSSTHCGPITGAAVWLIGKAVTYVATLVTTVPNPTVPVANPALGAAVGVTAEAAVGAATVAATSCPFLP